MPVSPASVRIDSARDELLDVFSKERLAESYFLPGETQPSHAFARAAAAFADDAPHAQRLYDYVSKGWFMFATPLLSNGGSDRGLPISCFLNVVEDSRQGIFDHWAETGWLSSAGGGVGTYYGLLRSAGERTSHGSSSTGKIPFIAVNDRLILSVSQGDTRRGSNAIYIDVDDPEIEEFVSIRRKEGGDANRKALNLHHGVNITDAFMHAVHAGAMFPLRSRKTGEIMKEIDARTLWRVMLETRMKTGEPYLHFIDTSNRHLPASQKALGLKVLQSNLCVGETTDLLTERGYMPIAGLKDQTARVWNGQEWSDTTIRQTGENQELVRVWFEDGGYLDCTPYHKFHLADGSEVPAGALKDGAELEAPHHPAVPGGERVDDAYAYSAGWGTVAGFEDEGRLSIYIPETIPPRAKKMLVRPSVNMVASDEGLYVRFEPSDVCAGFAPWGWDAEAKRAWIGGAMDACAEWVELDRRPWLSLLTPDLDLVREMRLLALECGLTPRIRLGDTAGCFMLGVNDVAALTTVGMINVHGQKAGHGALSERRGPIVADVHPLPGLHETYCFTEPKRNRGVFAGYLTGQCTEITLPTGRDVFDKMRTAVCCLSSVNADTFHEWKDDPQFIEDLMRMLDNALDVFAEKAGRGLEAAVYSAMRERSVGLGLLGFHYYLQQNWIAFESEEARDFNRAIFSHIRTLADEASLLLGAERGEAPDMVGTGHRFAHRIAVAPNATSSILCNSSASTEPVPANIYLHKTISGSHTVKNRHLVAALAEKGLDTEEVWSAIKAHEGSVQFLTRDMIVEEAWGPDVDPAWLEALRAVFKCATEIDQNWIITHAADRQPFIDQAQSVNLFFPAGANAKALNRAHFDAWSMGLKSLYYCRSTTAQRAENTNSKVEREKLVDEDDLDDEIDLGALVSAMSGPVIQDETCFGCQG